MFPQRQIVSSKILLLYPLRCSGPPWAHPRSHFYRSLVTHSLPHSHLFICLCSRLCSRLCARLQSLLHPIRHRPAPTPHRQSLKDSQISRVSLVPTSHLLLQVCVISASLRHHHANHHVPIRGLLALRRLHAAVSHGSRWQALLASQPGLSPLAVSPLDICSNDLHLADGSLLLHVDFPPPATVSPLFDRVVAGDDPLTLMDFGGRIYYIEDNTNRLPLWLLQTCNASYVIWSDECMLPHTSHFARLPKRRHYELEFTSANLERMEKTFTSIPCLAASPKQIV